MSRYIVMRHLCRTMPLMQSVDVDEVNQKNKTPKVR